MTNSLPSLISYVCGCGHVMVVSVPHISQERDEYRKCVECGEQVPWDEFTVDGPEDTTWKP